jgi:histidinol phosphatase-like enzyme
VSVGNGHNPDYPTHAPSTVLPKKKRKHSVGVSPRHFTRRDGVINADVGPPGVTSVSAFRLIPGAAAAIAKLKVAGAAVCVVTNHTCVGRGLVGLYKLNTADP